VNGVDVVGVVKDIGFPIFVAAYLLLRLERTLSALRDTLGGLRNTLAVMVAPWNGIERRREGGRGPWQSKVTP
jgi:hypothetical protein